MTNNTTKKCTICQEEKDISLFYHRKGKVQLSCKKCSNKKDYNRLKNNSTKYAKKIEQQRVSKKLRRMKIAEKLNHIKIDKGCFLCGYNNFASALAFHHLNPNEKKHKIADMMAKETEWKAITIELEKCLVLCFNCHIALHAGLVKLP